MEKKFKKYTKITLNFILLPTKNIFPKSSFSLLTDLRFWSTINIKTTKNIVFMVF